MQLTNENVQDAVSMLAETIREAEGTESKQSSEVLDGVANYFMELATFVNQSSTNDSQSHVNITSAVSYDLFIKRIDYPIIGLIIIL